MTSVSTISSKPLGKLHTPLLAATEEKAVDPQGFILGSPYPDILLDLHTFDHINADIARRLQCLRSYGDHLDAEYPVAFNFDECFRGVSYDAVLYVVVFRSTVAKSAVSSQLFDRLHAQDRESYVEANQRTGGLLKYWFGTINSDRRNLATCLWVDQEHAKEASKLPAHQKAIDVVRFGVYEDWKIERYRLHLGPGTIDFVRL